METASTRIMCTLKYNVDYAKYNFIVYKIFKLHLYHFFFAKHIMQVKYASEESLL